MASTEDTGEGKKKSGSLVTTIAAVLGLSVVAAGGGWFLGTLLAPQKKAIEQVAAAHEGHGKSKEDDASKELISTEENGVVLLQPLTTNLAYPSDTWIRVEVALLFRDHPDVKTAEAIHQDLMTYLRTVSLQQIQGSRGFQHLREDMQERAELRSKGRVESLMFRTFVIE